MFLLILEEYADLFLDHAVKFKNTLPQPNQGNQRAFFACAFKCSADPECTSYYYNVDTSECLTDSTDANAYQKVFGVC